MAMRRRLRAGGDAAAIAARECLREGREPAAGVLRGRGGGRQRPGGHVRVWALLGPEHVRGCHHPGPRVSSGRPWMILSAVRRVTSLPRHPRRLEGMVRSIDAQRENPRVFLYGNVRRIVIFLLQVFKEEGSTNKTATGVLYAEH